MKPTRKQRACAFIQLLVKRVRIASFDAFWEAALRAVARNSARTKRGTKFIRFQRIAKQIDECRAMGDHGTMQGNNFVGVHRQLLIDGTADQESIQLLFGWLGNVITAMGQRYKRGNKTMRMGIRIMARGRRAIAATWRRWVRWQKVRFEGAEVLDFEDAFDLAMQFTPSLSKVELRDAFRLSDKRHKRFAKRAQIASYI